MQNTIRSLVYVSRSMQRMSLNELSKLLIQARASNQANGISGVLLHHDGLFLQLMEGDPEAIDALFKKIMVDRRHEGVLILVDSLRDRPRMFPDWKMGFYHFSSIERVVGPGLMENATHDMDKAILLIDPEDPVTTLMATVWNANRQYFERSPSA
ncbi:BLUF domain-containing protein [Actimicrobium sp. CCC2.4]|uniref:BLUF domain-containing protein n=1 Tax=Actimicrobium sp. CCC2.4 TaxID=3048606 RepID=UPI002AC89D13|nr:BLUF domain-containing protein [Actimicrobium sp. CCC2.4]MEB0136818.1 BLUF domain-containing protein [Actimicrobium sp. CCC2.4]WPX33905.1 BLUF domain-containing protein [Actimicrobium sp. CCC2.4]